MNLVQLSNRRVLVTGASGFIGRNLVVRLGELSNVSVSTFVRTDKLAHLRKLVDQVDAVVHLAAENRPKDESAFDTVNRGLTAVLCSSIGEIFRSTGRHVPLILTSSIQAKRDTPYGRSKLAAENIVMSLAEETGNPCVVFRLPGVFGKWCKPNYNSVVATFCHNIARDLPIQVSDPKVSLSLVYVDDVVEAILNVLKEPTIGCSQVDVTPEYSVTLGEIENQIREFSHIRSALKLPQVGSGFLRALYSTYVSNIPKNRFSYELTGYSDARGVFVEMLKTVDSGQISYFTAHPGITRGGHYHHTKTEKFLVVKGQALFRFRNLITSELVELKISGSARQVVDTIPGWTHDITNVGNDEMIVMLWANENFDQEKPDTVSSKIR